MSGLLCTDADVVRALVAAARAGEPFRVEGVTYVPEARLLKLCADADVVARLAAELTRTVDRGGLVPTSLIRKELGR